MHDIEITVPGKSHSYRAKVGPGVLSEIAQELDLGRYSRIFVITDDNLKTTWLPKLLSQLTNEPGSVAIPAGEPAKNLETIQQIWAAMRQAGCDRHSLVLILGGGVVGDLGAFAASTYMRGVSFAHLPTTLLSQVDSSIGGKTGFDFDGLKNFIGTFAEPIAVIADTDTLESLPPRELTAGFAEILRHGLIKDAGFFTKLSGRRAADLKPAELATAIATSIRIKSTIIESDETESGQRKLLNFGHTVGHAVEALSWQTPHPLLHGEAVAIGIVVEADLSHRCSNLSAEDVDAIKQAVSSAGLPTVMPHLQTKQLLEKMHADKKDENGVIEFTLLERIGQAVYNQTVPETTLVETLTDHMEPEDARSAR